MTRAIGWWLAGPLIASLVACGGEGAGVADIGTLWGEESAAERAAREELEARRTNKVPMQAVRSVEIGPHNLS